MNKSDQLVEEIIVRLQHLGPLTSRSMFGGYGICQNKIMFSIVSNNKFYLRANDKLEAEFINYGMEQLIYMNRSVPVPIRYYCVDARLWKNVHELNRLAYMSLIAAIQDKSKSKGNRLKDLPNISLSLERLLRRAGIYSPENLFDLGAVKAFQKVKDIQCYVSQEVLFALAGAIEGCHAAALTERIRLDLLAALE